MTRAMKRDQGQKYRRIGMEVVAKIKDWVAILDGFPKLDTAYLNKTRSGGYVTLITYLLMGALMGTELYRYIFPPTMQRYVVDPTLGSKIKLNFDVSIASGCEKFAILLSEQTGATRMISQLVETFDEHFEDNLPKSWIEEVSKTKDGVDNLQSYRGCRIRGSIPISKSSGNLMIIPLMSTLGPIGQIMGKLDGEINFSHYIHQLDFGNAYPGMKNPLNGAKQLAMEVRENFTYFLSVISTDFVDGIWSKAVRTNQYVLNGFKGKGTIQDRNNPGLYFKYDHEALALNITRQRMSLRLFFVHLVGILGGIYTCSALIHGVITWCSEWCLWLIGKDKARKRAGRFDSGWSPSTEEEQSIILKSAKAATVYQNDDCVA